MRGIPKNVWKRLKIENWTKSNNSEVEREKIETLYRTFLLELFTAWNETISKG